MYQALANMCDLEGDARATAAAVAALPFEGGILHPGVAYCDHNDVLPYHPEMPRHFDSTVDPEDGAHIFERLVTFKLNPAARPWAALTDMGHAWSRISRQAGGALASGRLSRSGAGRPFH